jgi:hypothetical protein
MKRFIKLFVATCVSTATLSTQAGELTDLWWQPNESGWGANVVQNDGAGVVTLFVYGPNGEPVWYIAPNTRMTAMTAELLPVMTGTLYKARGPWFGSAFDPAAVVAQPVGEITIEPRNLREMTFRYRIDGVTVSKTAARLNVGDTNTLELTANHVVTSSLLKREGTAVQVVQGTGPAEFDADGSRVSLGFMVGTDRCTVAGFNSRDGRFARIVGTFACGSNHFGAAEISEIEVTRNGFSAKVNLIAPTITWSGRLGGVRR